MRDEILLGVVAVAGVVVMTVSCFYFTGQDGAILAAASTAIGTILGYFIKAKT